MTDLTGAVCEAFDIKKCIKETYGDEEDEDEEDEEDEDEEDEDEDDEEDEEDEDDEEDDEDEEESNLKAMDLDSLWTLMRNSYKMNSLMNCAFNSDENEDDNSNDNEIDNSELPCGLISNHAYSILQVVELKRDLKLIKLRNPHGGTGAWKGAWSIQSKKWKKLDKNIKKKHKMDLNPKGR